MFLRARQDPNAHKLDSFPLFSALKNNQQIYLIPAVSHLVSLSFTVTLQKHTGYIGMAVGCKAF